MPAMKSKTTPLLVIVAVCLLPISVLSGTITQYNTTPYGGTKQSQYTARTDSDGYHVHVTITADSPVAVSDGIRYRCTGYKATGCCGSGDWGGSWCSFWPNTDGTITWKWKLENRIAVVVSGSGSCSFGTQWISDGSSATAEIVPSIQSYEIVLSGDTSGVVLDGTTLSIPSNQPRQIAVTIAERKLSLEVSSAQGMAVPDCGTSLFSWNDTVNASVTKTEESDRWLYVCRGWRGTGSVPASGTGTNVTFSIMEDSTLTWLWETNVWIECAVSGDAAGSFAGWVVKDGASVVVPFETDVKRYTVATSGDTAGVAVDMAAKTVTIPADAPHAVSVTVSEVVGTGDFPLSWSDPAGFAAWSMVEEESAADGWCLKSGSVAAGETSATEISVEGPGLVEFDWKISANRGDYARVYVDGTRATNNLSRSTGWKHAAVAVEGAGPHAVRWTYERQSAQASGADAAFLDNVQWRPARTLEVSSAAGKPTPKAGTTTFYYGDEVSATVAETKPPRGTRRTFLGWAGTGSVPASGTATNVTFEITEDSTIAWNWLVEHRIEFHPSGAVGADFESAWVREGETTVVPYRLFAGYDSLALGGDTAGVALDETARTVAIPADGPRTVTLRTVKAIPLADALDAPAVGWSTDEGAAAWLGQDSDTSDGEDAATSGAPAGAAGSVLTATVPGPGTLSWKWKLVADGVAGVDVILDGGEAQFWLEEPCDWTDESLVVEGDGPHEVTFLFWNTGTAPGDHAVLDRVTWSGAAATSATQATPAPVPFSWLSGHGLAADGNYGGAAFAPAANPAYDIWQCWLAGISPVDPDAQFRAAIRMVDGEPVVTPVPDLGAERDYTVVGKASLEEYDWLPAGAASRFFRVKVSMPQ